MPPHTPTGERVSRGQSWPSGVRCRRAGGQAAGSSLLTRCVSLQRAFNALCHSTHLYGRRLVLEWADSEVSLQALRRKTAEHFHGKRTAGGQAPSHPCPSMSSTPTLRIPSASPSQWGVLTSADGIGGLHTRGVFPHLGLAGSQGEEAPGSGWSSSPPHPLRCRLPSYPAAADWLSLPPKATAPVQWPSPPSECSVQRASQGPLAPIFLHPIPLYLSLLSYLVKAPCTSCQDPGGPRPKPRLSRTLVVSPGLTDDSSPAPR